ncbi:suppression of tumorigenicity, putative [Entamoeba invadens IP1]|uniref:Suppression of tumorigenicity, putative n=1 Tax=Entamoeba invadens IP1 TaxID=370355 RepID=A0A0A1U9A5_ENTIV|nr:suppression of tumorigenicity, putative [Entamoeba invadens IP1]ELP91417.1 suppression of tumorigenicity, putative [Entamoeba invadens IP1]|eukprot:XP_004258188.1 suppression of tumorigenicity, putative [Entamoeba invadens IP1]
MNTSKVLDYVIHFSRSNTEKAKNVVDFKAPRDVSDQDNVIFEFCYPEALVGTQKERYEIFGFILTGMDGLRKYCYCRRHVVSNKSDCLCLVAQNGSFEFYENVIKLFEKYLPNPTAVEQFAQSMLETPFPFPNETIHNMDPGKRLINYSLTRPISDTFANTKAVSTRTLLEKFGASEVIDILSQMLLERKFLFVSEYLMTLSNTISAFMTLMFPFVWQHVLIPLLPKSLVTYCAAPMPFIIGCLKNLYPNVQKECGDISDVYVIDIDKGTYLNKPDFPIVLISDTSVGLRNILASLISVEEKSGDDALVRAQVLKFYQRLFLNYQKYFKDVKMEEKDKDNPRFKRIKFNWTKFMKKLDADNETFMAEFQQSQMLNMFIEDREDMLINSQSLITKCPLLLNSLATTPDASTATCHWKVLTDLCPSPTQEQKICFLCGQDILANMPCSIYDSKPIHSKCYRCLACFKMIVGDKESPDHRCFYCKTKNIPCVQRTDKDYQAQFNSKTLQKSLLLKKWKREIKQTVGVENYMKKCDSDVNSEEFVISEPTNFQSVKVDINFDTTKPAPAVPTTKTAPSVPTTKHGKLPETEKEKPKEKTEVKKVKVERADEPKKEKAKTVTATSSPPKVKKEKPTLPKKSISHVATESLSVFGGSGEVKKEKKSASEKVVKAEAPKRGNTTSKISQWNGQEKKSTTEKKVSSPQPKRGGVAKLTGMYENMN